MKKFLKIDANKNKSKKLKKKSKKKKTKINGGARRRLVETHYKIILDITNLCSEQINILQDHLRDMNGLAFNTIDEVMNSGEINKKVNILPNIKMMSFYVSSRITFEDFIFDINKAFEHLRPEVKFKLLFDDQEIDDNQKISKFFENKSNNQKNFGVVLKLEFDYSADQ